MSKIQDISREKAGSMSRLTIIRDSNEQHGYEFSQHDVILHTMPLYLARIKTVEIAGTAYEIGGGDYTILGMEHVCQVERKSLGDLYSSLGKGRGRFEARVRYLSEECIVAFVLVEADLETVMGGYKYSHLHPQSVFGTYQAWMIRYPNVQWIFAPGWAAGEEMCYGLLKKAQKEYADDTKRGKLKSGSLGRTLPGSGDIAVHKTGVCPLLPGSTSGPGTQPESH